MRKGQEAIKAIAKRLPPMKKRGKMVLAKLAPESMEDCSSDVMPTTSAMDTTDESSAPAVETSHEVPQIDASTEEEGGPETRAAPEEAAADPPPGGRVDEGTAEESAREESAPE